MSNNAYKKVYFQGEEITIEGVFVSYEKIEELKQMAKNLNLSENMAIGRHILFDNHRYAQNISKD